MSTASPTRATGAPRFLQAKHADTPDPTQDLEEDENAGGISIHGAEFAVSPPDDPQERQADRVADRAISLSQSEEDDPLMPSAPRIQRKCSMCGGAHAGQDDQPCDTCLQRKPSPASTTTAAAGAVSGVISSPSAGSGLDRSVRPRIEAALGHDLDGVRVHNDRRSHDAAAAIQARAFTHGNHIWLGRGESPGDVSLMAHEATHTVQQGQAGGAPNLIQRTPIDTLREQLDDDDERGAITTMGSLTSAEARAVLFDASMRNLATGAFWNSEMQEALMAMDGNLYMSLMWAFDEGTNYENVKALVETKTDIATGYTLGDDYMRGQFVSLCDNEEMVEIVGLLDGPFEEKLKWYRDEVVWWDDVARLLTEASPEEREALYDDDSIRDYFVEICGDWDMVSAVRTLGGTLTQQLLWLAEEDANHLAFEMVIDRAPRDERAAVYENEALRDHFQGMMTNLGMRDLVNRLGGPLSSQMEWLRNEGSDYAPEAAESLPSLDERDHALMAELEGAHHLFTSQRALEQAQTNQILSGFAMGGGGPGATPSVDRTLELADQTSAARRRRDADLEASGFSSMDAFDEAKARYAAMFQGYALQTAFQMLRQNKAIAEREKERYTPSGAETQAIHQAFDPAREDLAEANAQIRAATQFREAHSEMQYGAQMVRRQWDSEASEQQYNRMAEEGRNAKQGVRDQIRQLAASYPILADESLTRYGLIDRLLDADAAGLSELLIAKSQEKIDNIEDVEERLRDDTSKVWSLAPVINGAKAELRVSPNSIYDLIIQETISDHGTDQLIAGLGLAALAIGLGLLSGGIGAGVVAGAVGVSTAAVTTTAAIGSLAISAYSVSESYEDYSFGVAAANSAFERARAVSATEPSALWLALDIVGLILDLGGAVKAFRELVGPARGLMELGEGASDAALAADDLAAIREAAERAAAQTGVDADQLANTVIASVMRQRERAGILGDAAREGHIDDILRAARISEISELGEVPAAGLARLPDNMRRAVLGALDGRPQLIQEFGAFAEANQGVIQQLDRLRWAFGDSASHFDDLLVDLMMRRSDTMMLQLLDGLGSGALNADDLTRIVNAMEAAESGGARLNAFERQLAESLGRGGDDAVRTVAGTTEEFRGWLGRINPETAAAIRGDPELLRVYSDMPPAVRNLLTFCASPCVNLNPPPSATQVAQIESIYNRLSLPDEHDGIRQLLHGRSGDEMDRAIEGLEQVTRLYESGDISFPLLGEIVWSPGLLHVVTEDPTAAGRIADLWDQWRLGETVAGNPIQSPTFERFVQASGFSLGQSTRRVSLTPIDLRAASAEVEFPVEALTDDTARQAITDLRSTVAIGDTTRGVEEGAGTVALIEVDGQRLFGVNSGNLPDGDLELARAWAETLGISSPFAQQMVFHAEAHALMRMHQQLGGQMPAEVVMYVDRMSCSACQTNLPELAEAMNIERLELRFTDGRVSVIEDGQFTHLEAD